MIRGSFAVTTLLSSSCLRFIRGFTKSMQLPARKITANTRDPSAVIAISIRTGKEYICQEQRITENTRGNESRCTTCLFYKASLFPLKVFNVEKKRRNRWISDPAWDFVCASISCTCVIQISIMSSGLRGSPNMNMHPSHSTPMGLWLHAMHTLRHTHTHTRKHARAGRQRIIEVVSNRNNKVGS